MRTTPTIEVLDVEECLRLLASHPTRIGRLAFCDGDDLVVLPVNYQVRHGAVVFATNPGRKLSAVRDGRRVAFEVDDVDVAWRDGWSVLVQGIGREVTDPNVLAGVRATGLQAWAGPRTTMVEIISRLITGRRLC